MSEKAKRVAEVAAVDPEGNPEAERAIDLATQHFERLCSERRTFKVDEWDLTVYARPITAAQWQRISARNEKDGRMGALVEGIILFAEDQNGEKLFTIQDRGKLLNQVEHTIVFELGNWILSVQDLEDIVKN